MSEEDRGLSRRTVLRASAVLVVGGAAGCVGNGGDVADVEREGTLRIAVQEGSPGPGETVSLRITDDEQPVENASVRVDYQEVGTTDTDGTIDVTLPPKDDVAVDAAAGDREGELDLAFDGGDGEVNADDEGLGVAVVEGSPAPGATVTLRVTADGTPVAGARVEVGGEDAGTTDGDGRLEIVLPDDDEVEVDVDTSDRSGELDLSLADG